MNENIKKGISYTAFGFLFTVVSINLIFNAVSIDVMPDFVGWILLFLAYDLLGEYTGGKTYLKWTALVLAILTAAIWILGIVYPATVLSTLQTIVNIAGAVFTFIFLGDIENVARDFGSNTADTIRFLRYFITILYAATSIVALLSPMMGLETTARIVLVLGVVCLAACIFLLVVLFRLRKDVKAA